MKKILLGFIAIGLISCSDTKKDKYVEQAEKESSAIKAWAEKKSVEENNSKTQKLKIGDKAYGGIIAYIDSTGKHGLICALEDIKFMSWNEAKDTCLKYSVNGTTGWHLPSKEELKILHKNLYEKDLGGFDYRNYWASEEKDSKEAWLLNFNTGFYIHMDKSFIGTLSRPVRSF